MTRRTTRPRKKLRSEILSLALVLSLPLAVLIAFPYDAIGFRDGRSQPEGNPTCGFVVLTPEAEAEAIRTAFSVRSTSSRRLNPDLPLSTLPEEEYRPIFTGSQRQAVSDTAPLGYDPIPFPPTHAAPAPNKLEPLAGDASKPPARKPVFSREELLKID